jgi:hypothetical protein
MECTGNILVSAKNANPVAPILSFTSRLKYVMPNPKFRSSRKCSRNKTLESDVPVRKSREEMVDKKKHDHRSLFLAS